MLRALYRRAITDPTSLSRADKNAVLGRPSPEEEDRLCQDRVHLSFPELLAKALSDPQALSRDEAELLTHGADHHPAVRRADFVEGFLRDAPMSPEDRRLQTTAREALRDSEEERARANASRSLDSLAQATRTDTIA